MREYRSQESIRTDKVVELFGQDKKEHRTVESDVWLGKNLEIAIFQEKMETVVGATPLSSHLWKLHANKFGGCVGCDSTFELPAWPCSTIRLLAKEFKIQCPGRSIRTN